MTAERRAAGRALTRPEIGVLLSYAKIVLFDEIEKQKGLIQVARQFDEGAAGADDCLGKGAAVALDQIDHREHRGDRYVWLFPANAPPPGDRPGDGKKMSIRCPPPNEDDKNMVNICSPPKKDPTNAPA
mgnify:CR=1 FL=1